MRTEDAPLRRIGQGKAGRGCAAWTPKAGGGGLGAGSVLEVKPKAAVVGMAGLRQGPARAGEAASLPDSLPQSFKAASAPEKEANSGGNRVSYPQIFPVLIAHCAVFTGATAGLPEFRSLFCF